MNEPMTEQELREVEALAEKATPGPWRSVWTGNTVKSHRVYAEGPEARNIASGISPNTGNAEFIAASRAAVPRMAAEIRRLREENDLLRSALDKLLRGDCKYCDDRKYCKNHRGTHTKCWTPTDEVAGILADNGGSHE